VCCLFLIFVLSFRIQPFKFQVFAAARALFSLGAYCGTVLSFLGEMDGRWRGHHCPICVLKAKVNNFTFHIFPCFVFKISISFIFLYYSAYLHSNHLQFTCLLRSDLFTSNLFVHCLFLTESVHCLFLTESFSLTFAVTIRRGPCAFTNVLMWEFYVLITVMFVDMAQFTALTTLSLVFSCKSWTLLTV
jgi:hypothetical protein